MISTCTDVSIDLSTTAKPQGDAVAVFVTEGTTVPDNGDGLLSDAEAAAIHRLLAAGVSRGKAKELHFDLIERPGNGFRRVLVAGLGNAEKVTTESLRQAAGLLAKACRKQRLWDVSAVVPTINEIDPVTATEQIATGFLLSSFQFELYKGTVSRKKEDEAIKHTNLTLLSGSDSVAAQRAIDRARAIADGQNFCRTIASRPGNDINPPALARVAQEMADEVSLQFRVLDVPEMEKLGMGGILAVGAASHTPPRLIVLEHQPEKRSAVAPLLVVGKSITFDTGGISIKGADKMQRMIFDKCGGMAVLGLMYAAAKLKLPIPIVGLLSSAENTLGSRAYRPGDILKMYNGVTVEVTNTDAEGRLVLGDALAWGIETFKPSAVVDLATLTGGVIVALGSTMAGIMGNSDSLIAELQTASDLTGEKFWRLPLNDDHRDYIKSTCADIVNSGGREGHPLQGAAFLSHFIPKDDSVPWAHLDIAGVADIDKDSAYYAKGATGWGVRLLVEWAQARAKR